MDNTLTAAPEIKTAPAVPDVQEIVVNASELTFEDIETFLEWQGKNVDLKKMIPLLDRIVVGGVRKRKFIKDLKPILDAVGKAIEQMGNPPDKDGGNPLA